MNRAQAEALIRYIDAAIVAADGRAIGVFREHRNNALSAFLATVDEPEPQAAAQGRCEHEWARPVINPWLSLGIEAVAIRCAKCGLMPGVKAP